MTKNQKIAIAVGSGIFLTYGVIFVYQRIKRAQADASKVSSDEALDILEELKKDNTNQEPEFTEEDIIPEISSNTELTDLQESELISGMGDY
jgi:predicted DNA binding protein